MFVIVFGDPIRGINIVGDEDGYPFESYEDALYYVNSTNKGLWWIVKLAEWQE